MYTYLDNLPNDEVQERNNKEHSITPPRRPILLQPSVPPDFTRVQRLTDGQALLWVVLAWEPQLQLGISAHLRPAEFLSVVSLGPMEAA